MRIIHRLIIVAIVLTYFLVTPSGSLAKSNESILNRATVVPAKFELWGKPGETLEQSLMVTNEDDHEALLAISIENFGVTGENGEIALGQSAPGYPSYLSYWIEFDQQSTHFAPHETKTIKYKITIPQYADPGGKYAAIILSMDRVLRNPGETLATARVVSLVLLTIAGDIRDMAKVDQFKATKNTLEGEYEFELKLSNEGNNHIKPTGNIVITNFFGKKIDELSLEGENVLPGVTRKMVTRWKPNHFLFGRYSATVVANYGEKINNRSISVTRSFYVWPRSLGIILIFSFGACVFLATRRINKKKLFKNS